jgi:3-deoxy-D-manno-octulosonic-acid transferase
MGPHTFNFAEAAIQAEQHGAAIRVPSMTEAWAPTQRWVDQPETAQTAQGAARQWLAQGQGAALACAQSLLSTPHP